MIKSYDFVLYKFSNEVVLGVNVFGATMLNRIFGNINSTLYLFNLLKPEELDWRVVPFVTRRWKMIGH